LLEIDRAEVLAVTAIQPTDLSGNPAFTLEVELAEQMTSILTLDGILARGEESSFVFGTEYSHFASSL
jgi:hypothetical protein